MSKPGVYTRGAYLGLHVGGCRLVYLVRHLTLPVGGVQTHAWNPVVYTRYMQGWFFQAGVYLVRHLMLPVGGGHRHRKGAPNPT